MPTSNRRRFATLLACGLFVAVGSGRTGLLAAEATSSAEASKQDAAGPAGNAQQRTVRIGAVAYAPSAVTVFENLRRYFDRHGLSSDYTLYSNYDALVEALEKGRVDIAWNTPLAHARYQRLCGKAGQELVMRDVDCGFRSKLIVRKDARISRLADLYGKTLVLGSQDAAEATVLPIHFLKREGLDFDRLKVLSLDREVDLRGNPCSSEQYVLKALQEGRGQAGVVGERLWRRLCEQSPEKVETLEELWTSPPFSHCVFTARKGFDRALAGRFTELMLSMKPDEPLTAELMQIEGTKAWVAGSRDGFETLLKAIDEP